MNFNSIELRHLRYFVALSEELNFSRAAERCHVSQPPFSVAIQQLENYLGVVLVIRTTRNVELTPAGKTFYEHALQITSRAVNAFLDIQDFSVELGRTIRIGFHASMLYRGLPEAIENYKKHNKKLRLTLHEMASKSQLDAVLAGELDIGFTHSMASIEHHGIGCFSLFAEPFVLCVPKHYKIQGETVDLSRFRDENFIIFDRNASPHYFDTIISICIQAGFTPKIEHESKQWLTTISLVAKGLGVAIVPDCLIRTENENVNFYPINTEIVSYLQCIYSLSENKEDVKDVVSFFGKYINQFCLE